MRHEITPANQALSVNGNGSSTGTFQTRGFREKTVQVYGTFAGTITIEGTLDSTTAGWSPVAASLTAPGLVQVTGSYDKLRITGSGWSSGTANALFSGFNSRTDPG